MAELIPGIITLIPFILLAFMLRWIRQIKNAMALQIQQNEEIINLLKQNISGK
ncbi:hypothetical protein ACFOZY_13015 [Chungangia koreensis]|uniref:Uncharacterized protein n=1 Tax=Chungangia koreensis TaxID=752657 RepID=A0ABV8X9N0_9LACT